MAGTLVLAGGGDHFFKHSRADAQVPVGLRQPNGHAGAVPGLDLVAEVDLAIARNAPIHLAHDHHVEGGIRQMLKERRLPLRGHGNLLRVAHDELRLPGGVLQVLHHGRGVLRPGRTKDGGAAILQRNGLLLENHAYSSIFIWSVVMGGWRFMCVQAEGVQTRPLGVRMMKPSCIR